MEALVVRVEALATSLEGKSGAAADQELSPTNRLAAMLKEALAANTIGGKVEEDSRFVPPSRKCVKRSQPGRASARCQMRCAARWPRDSSAPARVCSPGRVRRLGLAVGWVWRAGQVRRNRQTGRVSESQNSEVRTTKD